MHKYKREPKGFIQIQINPFTFVICNIIWVMNLKMQKYKLTTLL